MAGIFLIQDNGELVEMNEQAYALEDHLQELLAKYPNLLAGDQISSSSTRRWLLVKREMGIPGQERGNGRWSLDHLFLDQDGVPTLVEVKRNSDTRIRREVVGQMLDYAANAVVYWPIGKIREEFERSCEINDRDPLELVQELIGNEEEVEAFWKKTETNLQAGRIRMLFVADIIPPELRRIVEFLNKQMTPAEVLAIEIRQYVGKGMKTLVPRVIGQIDKPSPGGNLASTDEARLEFWTSFCDKAVKQGLKPAPESPTDEASLSFVSDDPTVRIVGVVYHSGELAVRLWLEGPRAQVRWDFLKNFFEQRGNSLTHPWRCGHGKKGRGFLVVTSTDLALEMKDQWPQMHQWLMNAVRELGGTLLPLIRNDE